MHGLLIYIAGFLTPILLVAGFFAYLSISDSIWEKKIEKATEKYKNEFNSLSEPDKRLFAIMLDKKYGTGQHFYWFNDSELLKQYVHYKVNEEFA